MLRDIEAGSWIHQLKQELIVDVVAHTTLNKVELQLDGNKTFMIEPYKDSRIIAAMTDLMNNRLPITSVYTRYVGEITEITLYNREYPQLFIAGRSPAERDYPVFGYWIEP